MKLQELKRLCDAATPGPWSVGHPMHEDDELITVLDPEGSSLFGDMCVGMEKNEADVDTARFIAASRNYMPMLLEIARCAWMALPAFCDEPGHDEHALVDALQVALSDLDAAP